MRETALVLVVPEAEPYVREWRARHDPSAAQGMPAHITLIYPFAPLESFDAGPLIALFASQPGLDLSFARTARFPDTLWLAPEPKQPLVALISALAAAYPAHPPYGGEFADIAPHLTVAQGEESVLERIAQTLKGVRFTARIGEASLFAKSDARWRRIRNFALAGKTP